MDEKNYYIGIEGMICIRFQEKVFVEGKQEEFEKFIKEKTGKKMMYVPFKMKNKFAIIRENMKAKEKEHDLKLEKKKKGSIGSVDENSSTER